jgi:hypothetical protein
MKGKPWSVEEEQLQKLLLEQKPVRTITMVISKSIDCIRKKSTGRVEVVVHEENQRGLLLSSGF